MTQPPSTDNPEELFSLVDRDDRVIGQATRGQCHSNPALIHRSIQILLWNNQGELLLQKRSMSKDLFPGAYCASASGHVDLGESYEEAANREIREELGVIPSLRYITRLIVSDARETEMSAIFTARHDGPFYLNRQEVAGVTFFSLGQIAWLRSIQEMFLTTALASALDYLDTHPEQFIAEST